MAGDSDLVGLGDLDSDDEEDERLMAALRRLAALVDAVPLGLIAAARAAFAWRTLDAELAELCYDSALIERSPVGVRSTAAEGRFLNFEAPGIAVEMEAIAAGSNRRLTGQFAPPRAGPVEVRQPGRSMTAVADDRGRFLVDDLRAGPLSLRFQGDRPDGAAVITDWVLL